ncbi:MAG: glycosyltransferase family 4 protein [Magnetococcales bacterium]|nr:glycosyltransferase family 4 protein [Magnetococcales bacterium]
MISGVRKSRRPKILFLVTEDWYFWSHRLPLARAVRNQGCDVVVAVRVDRHGEKIIQEGFRLAPLAMKREGLNPLNGLRSLTQLITLYLRERPDLVHHVAIKPVLLGTLAAILAGVPRVVNAFAGLGYAFTTDTPSAIRYRKILRLALPRLLGHPRVRVVAQNLDDAATLAEVSSLPVERLTIIPGSGVDPERFQVQMEPPGDPVVTMVSRMLWDKGVAEFVAAAARLKKNHPAWRFLLVGSPDPHNPSTVPEAELRAWHAAGTVEWLGEREDIPDLLANTHVAVLPSYREGFPKSLLEAAACGRAIVAADVPGCRHVVQDGVNGLLIPRADAAALAIAIERLGLDGELRRRMGRSGRQRVEEHFAQKIIVQQTLALYATMGMGRCS